MTTAPFDLSTFFDTVAAPTPLPAGGAVAALAGALAAALAEMGAGLALKQPQAAVAELARVQREAAEWRAALLRAITEDVSSYRAYLAARALPRGTEVERRLRDNTVARTRLAATLAPLNVATLANEVLDFLLVVAERGMPAVRGDLAVGALLAETAVRASVLNARLNLRDHPDADERTDLLVRAAAMEAAAAEKRAQVWSFTEE